MQFAGAIILNLHVFLLMLSMSFKKLPCRLGLVSPGTTSKDELQDMIC